MRVTLARAVLATVKGVGRVKAKAYALLVGPAFGTFGRRSVLQPPVRLGGEKWIHIGESVSIGRGSWLQVMHPIGAETPELRIGDRTSASGYLTVSVVKSVVVDTDVLLARHVYISDHAHRYSDPSVPVKAQGVSVARPVRICSGAWLGQGVVVCPGVRIGRNAVVGANSVVKDDIPDNAVAVGAPARVVRMIGTT
jgi:acetyltransferase-like isoleucine patch superfamily enzyme